MEFKELKFDIKMTNKEETDGDGMFRFEGLASTFDNIDLDGDIIVANAFTESLQKRTPKLMLLHNLNSLPVGIVEEAKEINVGLFIRGAMPIADRRVREEIMPQMHIKSIDSMSIGFRILDSDIEERNGEKVRVIKKVELFEISLVTFPANPQAQVTALKSYINKLEGKNENEEIEEMKTVTPWGSLPKTMADRERRWDSTAAVKRWRENSNSSEAPSERYKNNFLWYDRENAENFGAYKLPIGDVIDGKHVVIPRAVFAARAALAGARGGVDIPDSDRAGVEANINKYYEAMELEPPFSKGKSNTWTIDEIKHLSNGELNFVLRSGDISRKSADYIVSLVSSAKELNETRNEDEAKQLIDEITNFKMEIQKLKGELNNAS